MQRAFHLGVALFEPILCSNRCLAVSRGLHKWNHIKYAQNLDLGRQAFQVLAVKSLIDNHPDLSADDVNDVANGMASDNFIYSKLQYTDLANSVEDSSDILQRLGELTRKGEQSSVEGILDEIKNKCLVSLSWEDRNNLIKSQHPRFLLRNFCDSANIKVYLSSIRRDDGYFYASVFFEKEIITTGKHEVKEEAERLACLATLESKFQQEFTDINLKNFEFPLELDVDLRSEHKQREVNLVKAADESFGFTICGGEQKLIKDKEYIQLNIITPVFISSITEGSPADVNGLRVGDVLIGVNDHAFTDKTHEQVVISLKKFSNHEEVLFTVKYDKKELLKYEAEEKLLDRELERTRAEIRSARYRKWHDSKSKIDPEQYFLEKFVEKKRTFKLKKGGNKNRLWHQYKP